MRWLLAAVLGSLACSRLPAAGEWADRVADTLTFSSPDGVFRAHGSGLLSLTGYQGDQENPGMVFTTGDSLLSPRLTLFLDAQAGTRVSGFLQARADRGFDPADGQKKVRLDEYAIRWAWADDGSCNLEAGKFATAIGNWVARHDEWQNPFVNAPLPYEYLTGIDDANAATVRSDLEPAVGAEAYEYVPIIWGPSYASGAAVTGRHGRFDYAVEVKNTGPSSRPATWSLGRVNFAHPAYNFHVGFRPDLRLKFGFSASESVYLQPSAVTTLPPGRRLTDYRERLLGQDFSFEWHHFQLWAELFEAQFSVPGIGEARTVAGYVEMRWKLTPQLSVAGRVNRQVFSSLDDSGGVLPWSINVTRVDVAAAWRCTTQSLLKLQVSTGRIPSVHESIRSTYAAQFILRF